MKPAESHASTFTVPGHPNKDGTIEAFRGIAALMVVFYHYTSKNYLGTIHLDWLYAFWQFGFYGVHIFFVISGLVLPLSMNRSKYKIGQYGNFLARRIIRIVPPSWVAIGMILAIYWGVYILTGKQISGAEPLKYSFEPLLFNLTYTVPFFDTIWYNSVYWTLTVEFTFYLLVGLIFPFFQKVHWQNILIVVSISALSFVSVPGFQFLYYAPLFMMGVLVYLQKEAMLPKLEFWVALFLILMMSLISLKIVDVAWGGGSALALLYLNVNWKPLLFLGKVSYSLYITHLPVAYVSEMLLKRVLPIHGSIIGNLTMLAIYIIIALIFAALFQRFIEMPFVRLAQKLKSRKKSEKRFSNCL